jgi:hypothetical protein
MKTRWMSVLLVVLVALAAPLAGQSVRATKLTTPTVTATADLTISPIGDVVFGPGGGDVLPATSYTVALGSPTKRWKSADVAELKIGTLVAEDQISTVGGRLLVAQASVLTQDVASGGSMAWMTFQHNNFSTTQIGYLEGNGNTEFVQIGAYSITSVNQGLKQFAMNWTSSACSYFTVGSKWRVAGSAGNTGTYTTTACSFASPTTTVTVSEAIPSATVDGWWLYFLDETVTPTAYRYRVFRDVEASGTSHTWYSGDSIVNLGAAGTGWIDLYAKSGVKSTSEYGPTICGNVRSSTTWDAWAPRWCVGQLNGVYGYSTSTYGLAAGDPAGSWLKIDATNGVRMGNASTTKMAVDASGNASLVQGAVTIDSTGLSITPDTTSSDGRSYRFTSPHTLGGFFGTYASEDAGHTRTTSVLSSVDLAGATARANLMAASAFGENGQVSVYAPAASAPTGVLAASGGWQWTGSIIPITSGAYTIGDSTHKVAEHYTNYLRVGSPSSPSVAAGRIDASAIYDDGTLLSDWVLDLHFDGTTSASHAGELFSFESAREVMAREHRLPWMPTKASFEADRSLGRMVTKLWQGQEQQMLYAVEQQDRLTALEREVADLRAQLATRAAKQ